MQGQGFSSYSPLQALLLGQRKQGIRYPKASPIHLFISKSTPTCGSLHQVIQVFLPNDFRHAYVVGTFWQLVLHLQTWRSSMWPAQLPAGFAPSLLPTASPNSVISYLYSLHHCSWETIYILVSCTAHGGRRTTGISDQTSLSTTEFKWNRCRAEHLFATHHYCKTQ